MNPYSQTTLSLDEAYRRTQEIAEIETVDLAQEEARDTRFNILRTVWKYAT